MKIKEIPIEERPREKLLKYGKENLSDAELLAIVLKTGVKGLNVCDLSYEIINIIGGLASIKDTSFNKLIKIKGIGKAKAIELLALEELSKRIYCKEKYKYKSKEKLTSPEIIYNKTKDLFINKKQEYFYCLYLNTNKELIERKLLFMGTLNSSVVHPREIFKEAYKLSASSIVCLHNHPSGSLKPSIEDIKLTSSLIKIGKINGIPVVDHLIITEDGYYSFYENNKDINEENKLVL